MNDNAKILTPEEIKKRTQDKPWVSPFERIVGIHSNREDLVQVYEYHARNACYGAAAWAVFHYKRSSPLVLYARRDGARDIFTLRPGRCNLELQPSFSSAGIEAVEIDHEKIRITYSGLAGGGVGSSLCRALARGVDGAIIHAEGGGDKLGNATVIIPKMVKLHVGVDDTDKPGAGATWSLANEIAYELGKNNGIEYLNHTLVQLFPDTPEKTTNCVGTVLTFAVISDKFEYLKQELARRFSENTLSEHTGLAFYSGINIPQELKDFAIQAKHRVVTLEETKSVADEFGASLIPITGERGLIGAMASIGFTEDLEAAVRVD